MLRQVVLPVKVFVTAIPLLFPLQQGVLVIGAAQTGLGRNRMDYAAPLNPVGRDHGLPSSGRANRGDSNAVGLSRQDGTAGRSLDSYFLTELIRHVPELFCALIR